MLCCRAEYEATLEPYEDEIQLCRTLVSFLQQFVSCDARTSRLSSIDASVPDAADVDAVDGDANSSEHDSDSLGEVTPTNLTISLRSQF